MSPISHFLLGWIVANADGLDRRERAAVTIAAVIPDADGLGIIADKLTRESAHPLEWWSQYHHVLAHNLGFGLLVALVCFLIATKRWSTSLLALLGFHLHLMCDIIGARGPEGEQWPIPYLLPFSHAGSLSWSGQWALNAWPNFLITAAALAITFYLAFRRGYSPLEMVSKKADAVFIQTIRHRFSNK